MQEAKSRYKTHSRIRTEVPEIMNSPALDELVSQEGIVICVPFGASSKKQSSKSTYTDRERNVCLEEKNYSSVTNHNKHRE